MSYTMEQLVKALACQAVDEAVQPAGQDVGEMADNLYHLLKGLRPDSDQVQDVLDRRRAELDRYSFQPAKNALLRAIETVVRNKYNDDPSEIITIITQALE